MFIEAEGKKAWVEPEPKSRRMAFILNEYAFMGEIFMKTEC